MTDAEEILRKLLDNIVLELNYREPTIEVRALTSGGANYTSGLYSAEIKTCQDHLKLFAKVAMIGEKIRAVMNADTMFGTEQFVYKELVKTYEKLQNKYEVPEENRFMFPKFYGGNPNVGEETVVLEDLIAEGYENFDRMKSVDWEHAASAVEALAKFHALSFAYEKYQPEEFHVVADKMKYKPRDDSTDDEAMKEVWNKLIKRAMEAVKNCHKQKMIDLFEATTRKEDFYKYRMPLSRTVLVHGDYRPSNLLFRKLNGTIETMAVDYQTLTAGCPVADLLYFVFLGSDGQFRRQHYHQLLEHYYLHLKLALDRLQVDVSEAYPREVFDKEIKEMMGPALCISMVILPIVTVDAKDAPRIAGDADVGEFAFDPNELFAERFSELVSDCVKWGVL